MGPRDEAFSAQCSAIAGRLEERLEANPNVHGRGTFLIMQGQAIANKIGAKYMECSALTGEGVDLVFQTAAKLALYPHKKQGKGCTML